MADQRDDASGVEADRSVEVVDAGRDSSSPESLTRRALLRGAAIAAPTIVTMGSASAAMAASSFRTYTSIAGPQSDRNYYCLAEKSTLGPSVNGNPNALDVGVSPVPNVYQIPERNYRSGKNNSAPAVTEVSMCRNSAVNGTTYYYKESGGGWQGVKVKRGILMSAGAMGSLGVSALPIDNV